VPVMDETDVRCVHVPVRVVYSVRVSESASCVLEGWDLEVCTSLSPWRFMLDRILLQVLGHQARQLSLSCSLLQSGGRVGLLVFFPEGMVSCKPGQAFVLEPRIFCWVMWLL